MRDLVLFLFNYISESEVAFVHFTQTDCIPYNRNENYRKIIVNTGISYR